MEATNVARSAFSPGIHILTAADGERLAVMMDRASAFAAALAHALEPVSVH